MSRPPVSPGDWYQAEEPTRHGFATELQRIWRRIRARPLPVLIVAAVITGGLTRKIATKQALVEAYVVLALTEGAMANRNNSLPIGELRQYVTTKLLPDSRLIQLIEKRDLYRLRKTAGPQFAVEQLRESLSVQIWKNTFMYYDEGDDNARHSARIGLAVTDTDPDRAYDLARDLAAIAIESAAIERQALADQLVTEAARLRVAIHKQLDDLEAEVVAKQAAFDSAERRGHPEEVYLLGSSLLELGKERQRLEQQLGRIATSTEVLAGEIAEAGLDMSLSIVEDHRPERQARSGFVLIMIASVIGAGALVGAALVLGAFDSRVHDGDDVARLGLPLLGHIPRFAGDDVGSMRTRGAPRGRVPSFLRWRSHR